MGKKTFNFFDKITVTSGDFGNCVVSWNFISAGILLLNEGVAGNIVEYSFDGGVTVHGDLDPAKASVGLAFDNRHECRIWFRLKAGTSAVVRVESWA